MTLKEIFSQNTPSDVIDALKKGRNVPLPDVEAARKAIDPEKHEVNDRTKRPDKRVAVSDSEESSGLQVTSDVPGGSKGTTRPEPVARISLAIQQLIIKRAVSFLFGNDPAYNADTESEQQQAVMRAFGRILRDVKCNSVNRRVARSVFGYKECAELWYPVETEAESNRYGFPSRFKLRCAVFSPANGDTLYPYFDETGDMVAFSRSFARKDDAGNTVDFFETYTADAHYMWQSGDNGWTLSEGYPRAVAIGKIPVVYARQDETETAIVNSLIARLETLLSNFADTNDYHASPKLFITGRIQGFSKKGEAGAIIEGDEGSTMNYVSWAHAPESVRLEIETILKMIYTLTQTPDISFDSVKGIGAVSGVALKLLFMDAHLKVQDKREIFDDYLQRRANIIKAYIGLFSPPLAVVADDMEITPEITPYMLTNEIDELNYWLTANGNKPVVSQEESIEKAGVSMNPQATYEKLQAEDARSVYTSAFEPTL